MTNSNDEKNNSIQMLLEESMKKIHYESYEQWVNNFAINLDRIWEESSAKELPESKPNSSAIVIGRGPSIRKFQHLELLRDSDYNGSIVCCDGALIDTLKAGVTPEKFPNFYVVTIDPVPLIKKCYDDKIVDDIIAGIENSGDLQSDGEFENRTKNRSHMQNRSPMQNR